MGVSHVRVTDRVKVEDVVGGILDEPEKLLVPRREAAAAGDAIALDPHNFLHEIQVEPFPKEIRNRDGAAARRYFNESQVEPDRAVGCQRPSELGQPTHAPVDVVGGAAPLVVWLADVVGRARNDQRNTFRRHLLQQIKRVPDPDGSVRCRQ